MSSCYTRNHQLHKLLIFVDSLVQAIIYDNSKPAWGAPLYLIKMRIKLHAALHACTTMNENQVQQTRQHFIFVNRSLIVPYQEKIACFVWQIFQNAVVQGVKGRILYPIFSRKEKRLPTAGCKPFLSVICAKEPDGAVCGSYRSSFYHGAKIRKSAVYAPPWKLIGECLPQTLLCGLRRLSPLRSCGKK